jgi:hypothetical protein
MIAEIQFMDLTIPNRERNASVKLTQAGAAAENQVVRSLCLPARRLPARIKHNAIPVQFSETSFTPRIVLSSQTH